MAGKEGLGFWDFAVHFYGRQGVKPVLLELQDQHGLNIPLFLFSLWCGYFRRLGEPEMAHYINLAADYTHHLIAPVRGARRWLKSRETGNLYRQLLDAELECEKQLMARLEADFREGARQLSAAGNDGIANAELYLKLAPIRSESIARERLAAILDQFRQLPA